MIREERSSLADAFAAMPDPAWSMPSLCPRWSVRDVVGHMIATTLMTSPKFIARMTAARFRFDAMSDRAIREVTAGKSNHALADQFRSRIDARTAPPGPALTWLGETIVHGEDVFWALGQRRDHPIGHVIAVADFYKNSNLLIGAKRRIAGVTLQATDTDWRHGTGPEASGPAIALVLAMTGRKAALDDLTGDGVAVLRQRA